MLRLLLALFAFQAPAAEPGAGVDLERSKLRPSVVEVSLRVLSYATKNDYERAQKAAKILTPLHKELDAFDPAVVLPAIESAVKSKNLEEVRSTINQLVLADMHHLLTHLAEPVKEKGLTPRTRILLAQRSLNFLKVSIPKDKRGKEISLALEKLFRLLSNVVPHAEEYGRAQNDWAKIAESHVDKILKLIDATILKPTSAPTTAEA